MNLLFYHTNSKSDFSNVRITKYFLCRYLKEIIKVNKCTTRNWKNNGLNLIKQESLKCLLLANYP